MNLSPSLERVRVALSALPFADQIQVFGSSVREDAKPNDLDVFIDLRQSDRDPYDFAALLAIARRHYGLLDPFIRTKTGLLVRDEHAAWWVRAKHAKAIGAQMDLHGTALFAPPDITLMPVTEPRVASSFRGRRP